MNPMTEKRNLEQTLQALYDSEINVTITMLWDGGVDFAFVSSMEYEASTPDDWHNVPSFAELADALHRLALKTYPESDYAKKYGDGKVLPIRWVWPFQHLLILVELQFLRPILVR